MGVLTEATTRLCGEIGALRSERECLLKNLAREARDRATAVARTRAVFLRARSEMARRMKTDLATFTANLKRKVAGQERELRADLVGARRAWSIKRAF